MACQGHFRSEVSWHVRWHTEGTVTAAAAASQTARVGTAAGEEETAQRIEEEANSGPPATPRTRRHSVQVRDSPPVCPDPSPVSQHRWWLRVCLPVHRTVERMPSGAPLPLGTVAPGLPHALAPTTSPSLLHRGLF